MKKKILFTTLAIALIGLFGFSFSQNGQQTKQVNAVATRKPQRITSDYDSIVGSNKTYYLVCKNYSNNGEGVLYQGSITIDNSAIVNSDNHFASGDFTIINNDSKEAHNLTFTTVLSGGVYHLESIFLYQSARYTGSDPIYYYIYNVPQGTFTRNNCGFLATNFRNIQNDFIWYVSSFFDIYELESGQFTFNQSINYYAPYGQDIDTYFVNDSTMTTASSSTTKSILENTPFYSGGYVFDTIRLRYFNAIALTYYDNNGNRQTWGTNDFASYSWIEYVNSATNLIKIVNQRLTQSWNEGSASGIVQLKGSKWISYEYQKITFFVTPTDIQLTKLSTLNNSSYQGNTYITSNDIGLGSAFTLISQAFTAWLPILSVSVLPGITLGMLIFLPLIAGIIILIIWIVKR